MPPTGSLDASDMPGTPSGCYGAFATADPSTWYQGALDIAEAPLRHQDALDMANASSWSQGAFDNAYTLRG